MKKKRLVREPRNNRASIAPPPRVTQNELDDPVSNAEINFVIERFVRLRPVEQYAIYESLMNNELTSVAEALSGILEDNGEAVKRFVCSALRMPSDRYVEKEQDLRTMGKQLARYFFIHLSREKNGRFSIPPAKISRSRPPIREASSTLPAGHFR